MLTDGILYRSDLPAVTSTSLQFKLLRAGVSGFAAVPNSQALYVANSSSIVQLSYDWSNQAKQKVVFVSKNRASIIKGGLVKDQDDNFYFINATNATLVTLAFKKKTKKYQINAHEHLTGILPKMLLTDSVSQPSPGKTAQFRNSNR